MQSVTLSIGWGTIGVVVAGGPSGTRRVGSESQAAKRMINRLDYKWPSANNCLPIDLARSYGTDRSLELAGALRELRRAARFSANSSSAKRLRLRSEDAGSTI